MVPGVSLRPGALIRGGGGDGPRGAELWASYGTASGTILVLDIRSGNESSSPEELVLFDGRIFFRADDGARGLELWAYDSASGITTIVADANPSPSNGIVPSFPAVLE